MGILAVAQVQIVYFWTFPEYLPLIVGYIFQTNTTSNLTANLDFETHLTSQSSAEVGGRRGRWLS